jgi:hypothetical protein
MTSFILVSVACVSVLALTESSQFLVLFYFIF